MPPTAKYWQNGGILVGKIGGEAGIRTLGTFPYTAFPMLHLRPLRHLSDEVFRLFGGKLP